MLTTFICDTVACQWVTAFSVAWVVWAVLVYLLLSLWWGLAGLRTEKGFWRTMVTSPGLGFTTLFWPGLLATFMRSLTGRPRSPMQRYFNDKIVNPISLAVGSLSLVVFVVGSQPTWVTMVLGWGTAVVAMVIARHDIEALKRT